MNLIEELGLEKCKLIVDCAPSNAEYYSPLSYSNKYIKSVRDNAHESDIDNGYTKSYDFWDGRKWNGCACMPEHLDDLILISSIRTAIDQHYYGQSEEKELEQYAVLSQEKIEGGAVFVGDNSKIVQMVRDITDHCADIKNHLSPNTKVTER